MKYFLAYETRDGKLEKLEKNDVVPSSSDFKDVLDFTLSFKNILDLKYFLCKNKLLPEKYYSIYYASQTKKNDSTTIRKVAYPELKFKSEAEFYNPIYLKELLLSDILSINFINLMTSRYIKKMGLKKYVTNDLLNRLNQAYEMGILSRELKSLREYFENNQVKDEIDDLISDLETNKVSSEIVYANIEYLKEIISLQDLEVLNYYSHVRDRLLKSKVIIEPPVVSELFRIRAKYYYNKSIQEFYEPVSFEENIDNLLKLIICKYDELKNSSGQPIIRNGKKQKGFIIRDGKYVIKARELYELGTFLKSYEEHKNYYELSENLRKDIDAAIDENKDDFEEFLTEDDYKKLNRGLQ